MTYYKLREKTILKNILTNEKLPVPYISTHGNIIFKEINKYDVHTIRLSPFQFVEDMV
jgi:hypothetical protein